jgi:threonyl-tRNA synthetase
MIAITLPDGSVREFENELTVLDVAKDISEGLARNVLSARFNDTIVEASTVITSSGELKLYTWNDDEGKAAFWHSSAHVLAQSILALYPEAKLTIGPAIENGFYYDVDFGDVSFSENDLQKLEQQFLIFARQKFEFKMRDSSKADALAFYKNENNPFKVELIENLEDGTITFCDHSDFTDLCRGGHLPNTGFIKAIKLLSVAGAYWRGDEKKPQLTRIYGISFPKQKELTAYLELLEEAKKRDHRKLGKELDLFTFSKKVGQGLPLWLPKGAALRERLENFLKAAQKKAGYEQVISPHIGSKELYMTSGHYEKYGADSFQPIETPHEGETFLLKPMNCPHHCEIYNARQWSYKDLPKRYAEFGTVYRYEQSGELHGLTRVRGFTQDDAHIFCMSSQLDEEFKKVIDLVLYVFSSLGFENFTAQVSLRDPEKAEKYIGSDTNWELAESAIINAAKEKDLNYVIKYGEAAFYGPKLEHTGGNFPLWLTPEQVIILSVSEKYEKYAEKVSNELENHEIRALVDNRNETIGKKIRDAQLSKFPYMLIVGEKEAADGTVSVRERKQGDIGSISIATFIDNIKIEIDKTVSKFEV